MATETFYTTCYCGSEDCDCGGDDITSCYEVFTDIICEDDGETFYDCGEYNAFDLTEDGKLYAYKYFNSLILNERDEDGNKNVSVTFLKRDENGNKILIEKKTH